MALKGRSNRYVLGSVIIGDLIIIVINGLGRVSSGLKPRVHYQTPSPSSSFQVRFVEKVKSYLC